jgi:hypothetical protein
MTAAFALRDEGLAARKGRGRRSPKRAGKTADGASGRSAKTAGKKADAGARSARGRAKK